MKVFVRFAVVFSLFDIGIVFAQSETYSFENEVFRGVTYDAFMVKIDSDNLSKFHTWQNSNQLIHTDVITQNGWEASSLFAVNLSISDVQCNPLGLFIENSAEIQSLNLSNGKGNFYLKPNGVLLITDDEALIGESSQVNNFDRNSTPIRFAIQSGPLLIDRGKLNRNIKKDSQSRHRRCGVGITRQNGVDYLVFCLATTPVNFYEFTLLFKDKYSCDVALCLESAGCALKLPYIDNTASDYSGIVCNYLTYE
jgi:uncharacterized protein YigE (DUF2233 family)